MIERSQLIPVINTANNGRRADAIFVHGINADPRNTWMPDNKTEGFPEELWLHWLGQDIPDAAVWALGYPASAFAWKGFTMELKDRADNITNLLLSHRDLDKNRPIIFITHSMGGLLIKHMLRRALSGDYPNAETLVKQTQGIVFLSTPHRGADLANFIERLAFLLPNANVSELRKDEQTLLELNNWFCTNFNKLDVKVRVFCERYPTPVNKNLWGGLISKIVVDKDSATIALPDVPVTPLDADHGSICWVTSNQSRQTDQLYSNVFNFIKNILATHNADESYPKAIEKYLERSGIHQACYRAILEPNAVIVIKGSWYIGKTSLMYKILQHTQEFYNYRTVRLSFRNLESEDLTTLDRFLRWFCNYLGQELKGQGLQINLPNKLEDYWDNTVSSKVSCKFFFEREFLEKIQTPFVLGLDDIETMYSQPEITKDFFDVLREWNHQSQRKWSNLRLIVAYAQKIPLGGSIFLSPFNIGLPISLPEFKFGEINELANDLYQLNWDKNQIDQLIKMVGGRPYLIKKALNYIYLQLIDFEQLLKTVSTNESIYQEHLEYLRQRLNESPELLAAMKRIVNAPDGVSEASLQSEAQQLDSMGLVKRQSNYVTTSCQLYRQYFQVYL